MKFALGRSSNSSPEEKTEQIERKKAELFLFLLADSFLHLNICALLF